MPPIVISRNAIKPGTALPKVSPRRPGRKKRSEPLEHKGTSRQPKEEYGRNKAKQQRATFDLIVADGSGTDSLSSGQLTVGTPINITTPKTAGDIGPPKQSSSPVTRRIRDSALWRYLMLYMPHDTPLADSSLVFELLPLPRQRELPHRWKFQLAGGHPNLKTLCALLVYLSGASNPSRCAGCARPEVAQTPEKSLSRTTRAFTDCVTLPATASDQLKEYFGVKACCNCFYQSSYNTRGLDCISGVPTLAPDMNRIGAVVSTPVKWRDTDTNTPTSPSYDESDGEDGNGDSDSGITLLPAAAGQAPRYCTALPARMAGKAKLISIRKVHKTTPRAKPKRQNSIRRFAARLGAKAMRREVATQQNDVDSANTSHVRARGNEHTAAVEVNGARRSQRPLKQQQEYPSFEAKQSAASRATKFAEDTKALSEVTYKKTAVRSLGSSPVNEACMRPGALAEPNSTLSPMMADWEIAPGRIRTGTGDAIEGE